MRNRGTRANVILAVIAAIVFLAGGFVGDQLGDGGPWTYVSALMVAGGAVLLGMSVGAIAATASEKENPDLRRRREAEAGDERNATVGSVAKSRAFDLFGPVFGALILVYALTGVALPTVLLLVAAYLSVFAIYLLSLVRYQRRL